MAKRAKSSAGYAAAMSDGARCGICHHFLRAEPPNACDLVAGEIEFTHLCKLFKPDGGWHKLFKLTDAGWELQDDPALLPSEFQSNYITKERVTAFLKAAE